MAAKRERALSTHVEKMNSSKNDDGKTATMEDMHDEFHKKCDSPNRGLKPGHLRKLPEAEPQPLNDFQKLQLEYKTKLALEKLK